MYRPEKPPRLPSTSFVCVEETAAEMRRVVQVGDPAIVTEIHAWKRTFEGRIREYRGAKTR